MKSMYKSSEKEIVYLESTNIKLLTTVEGPLFNTGLDSNNKMKIYVNITLPTYSDIAMKNYEKQNLENVIVKLLNKVIFIEKYDKSVMIINLELIEFNSEILHYCMIAIMNVLCNLSIEIKGILTCSNVILDKNDEIVIDPNKEQEKNCKERLQIACLVEVEEIVLVIKDGKSNDDENIFKKLLTESLAVCKIYHDYIVSNLN